jgi:hypothetical protein
MFLHSVVHPGVTLLVQEIKRLFKNPKIFFVFWKVNVWVNNQLKHSSQHTKIAQIMNVLAQCGSSGSSSTHSAKYRALYIFSVYNAVPNLSLQKQMLYISCPDEHRWFNTFSLEFLLN